LAWRNTSGVMGLGTSTPVVGSSGASGPSGSEVDLVHAETGPNGSALEPMVPRGKAASLKAADSDPLEGDAQLAARQEANRQAGQRSASPSPARAGRKGTMFTRKEFVRLAASAGAGGLLLGGLPPRRATAHAGMPAYITNALEHQTYDMFSRWFSWLRRAGAKGYLGEHGVPNTRKPLPASEVEKWLTHFDKVYRILDSNVDVIPAVTAHVASIYAGDPHGLQIYGPDRTDLPIRDRNFARAFAQAAVVEAHLPTGARRGVNTSSGAVTQFGFSRSSPGTYGRHYVYPDKADFAYLRSRGLNLARIPFRWERVQPQLNGPLKSAELDRLRSCFDDASAEGMKVIPNVHTYG
jgi:hypothetical protein